MGNDIRIGKTYHIVQFLCYTNGVAEDKRGRVTYPRLHGDKVYWQPNQDQGPWPPDFQPTDFSTQQCQDRSQHPACQAVP